MPKPKISIVVAVTRKDAAIGNGGKLLFRISDDLKRFKALTRGHPIIMGRKTFESIGRPLPERTNIIITRNPDYAVKGIIVVGSLEAAIAKAGELDTQAAIIGGGEIFKQALPLADKLHLTIVESDAKGDVFFPNWASPTGASPDWHMDFTKETFREERFDEKTGLKYMWVDLERG
jgi:dihydrofolate reductase